MLEGLNMIIYKVIDLPDLPDNESFSQEYPNAVELLCEWEERLQVTILNDPKEECVLDFLSESDIECIRDEMNCDWSKQREDARIEYEMEIGLADIERGIERYLDNEP